MTGLYLRGELPLKINKFNESISHYAYHLYYEEYFTHQHKLSWDIYVPPNAFFTGHASKTFPLYSEFVSIYSQWDISMGLKLQIWDYVYPSLGWVRSEEKLNHQKTSINFFYASLDLLYPTFKMILKYNQLTSLGKYLSLKAEGFNNKRNLGGFMTYKYFFSYDTFRLQIGLWQRFFKDTIHLEQCLSYQNNFTADFFYYFKIPIKNNNVVVMLTHPVNTENKLNCGFSLFYEHRD